VLVLIGVLQVFALTTAPLSFAPPADSVKHSGLCWRARPAPRCSWFLVTEFGVSSHGGLTIEYGLMANLGRRSAVGGAVTFGEDESFRRTGLTVRYRRWLNPHLALESGAGPVTYCDLTEPGACGGRRGLGFQFQAAVHLWSLAAASASFEHLGAANRGYVGVKFGGYASPLAVLALAILQGATWD